MNSMDNVLYSSVPTTYFSLDQLDQVAYRTRAIGENIPPPTANSHSVNTANMPGSRQGPNPPRSAARRGTPYDSTS